MGHKELYDLYKKYGYPDTWSEHIGDFTDRKIEEINNNPDRKNEIIRDILSDNQQS